ncbi:MAG: helix-turn-helix transcriptional regulator [Bacilli bacterium]|nr:helix-turn-helix transcriptional regulator [Bacilli bacterium]
MIYLSDDYINKYCDVLSYLIGRSIEEGYSFDHIEKSIAHSSLVNELERSNITTIAFSSMEKIYSDIFPGKDNKYDLDIYGIFGWVGYTYMHLLLTMEITFEALFYLIPIHDMLNQYHLYHEMDYKQILDYANEQIKCSILNVVMKRKKVSSNELSHSTGLSFATINSLRYGKRDITKLAGDKLLLLSRALNVKMETLLPQIHLIKM